jgi:hypothetical protein
VKIKTKAELALEKALMERGIKKGEKPRKKAKDDKHKSK